MALLNIQDFLTNSKRCFNLVGFDMDKIIDQSMSSSEKIFKFVLMIMWNTLILSLMTLTMILSFNLDGHPDVFLKITKGITAVGENNFKNY